MAFSPPIFGTLIAEIQAQTAAIQALETAVLSLQADIEITKNLTQWHLESIYGPHQEITDIANGGPVP